jgi:hypothetical protein
MLNKHQITEERYEGKLSRTVLKTNGVGDNLVEFNVRFVGQKLKTHKRFGGLAARYRTLTTE